MFIAIGAICGLIIGGIIAWLISANQTKSKYDSRFREYQDKVSNAEGRASALETTIEEVRKERDERSNKAAEDFDKLRDTLTNEQRERVRAETQSKELLIRLEEEKQLLADAKEKLTDSFKALAGDTLKSSNQDFLKLAKETFDKILAESKGDIGKRQEAIDGIIRPLSDSLKQFGEHVRQLEKSRESAYSGLEEHLKNLTLTNRLLQKETGNLVTALRKPQVRGRWGEMTLRRVVELAGMSEHCDFSEQVSVESEDGRLRPDLIIHLPSNREIIVDAKVSLDAYLDAMEAETEEEKKQFLIAHARQIRTHMNNLGSKTYWSKFKKAPEYVVMFIPGESFFADAAHNDLALVEDAVENGVMIATPILLITLVRTIAYGWRQEQITQNAQEISELGKQLYDRMRTLTGHLVKIGDGLEKATTAYNKAGSSIERRVLPTARKFKDLGVGSGDAIPSIEHVEMTTRMLDFPELESSEEDNN